MTKQRVQRGRGRGRGLGRGRGRGRGIGEQRRPRCAHRTRPWVSRHEPQHVTLRLRREIGHLRGERTRRAVYRSLARGCERFGTRAVHFSVQGDHVQLIVEAQDRRALTRAIKGISVRIARALNKIIGRCGPAFADRYHARGLASPRQVRDALTYVLCDYRHHAAQAGRRISRWWIDPCSSGWYFTGWRGRDGRAVSGAWAGDRSAPRLAQAGTWLLRVGWRKAGLIEVHGGSGLRP